MYVPDAIYFILYKLGGYQQIERIQIIETV